MIPLTFELLFQAQVIFLGLQVKVSIIWKEHKERDKRFFGGFSLHLWVSFSIVVERNEGFSMGNSFFFKFQTFKIWNFCEKYFNFNSF
jgi:hypothetical protein